MADLITTAELDQNIQELEQAIGSIIVDFVRKTNKPIMDIKVFHTQNGLSVMALVGAANVEFGPQIIRPN